MNPIDPYRYLQQVAQKLAEPGALQERGAIETVLDEVEYLFDVLDPEMQDGAERLIAELHSRLERAG